MIAFIDEHRERCGPAYLPVLPIDPSTYHSHFAQLLVAIKRPARSQRDAAFKIAVLLVFARFGVSGVRNVWPLFLLVVFFFSLFTFYLLLSSLFLLFSILFYPFLSTIIY